jgi:hypothetical protein
MSINIIIELLSQVIGDKKKSNKLIKIIDKLIESIESKMFIFKFIIILLSYNPNKVDTVISFWEHLERNKEKTNTIEFLKRLSKINLDHIEDDLMDKIIFKTFDFIEEVFNIKDMLILTYLNEILINIMKLKIQNKILKINIYLKYLKESRRIFNKYNNDSKGLVYLKISEVCGVSTRLINDFISR